MISKAPPRVAVLISGQGTNLQAFIDACARGELAAQISLVISNNPEAAGLQRAKSAGLTVRAIDHREFATREAFDEALVRELGAFSIDLVILAGFMRILTPILLETVYRPAIKHSSFATATIPGNAHTSTRPECGRY